MGKQIQLLRGNTTENNNFTGLVGSLTYDTQTKCLRVHDGSTAGGKLIPSVNVMTDYVIAYQLPSSGNNYSWYRKYKSGWVEQGSSNPTNATSITFPIKMLDTNYTATCMGGGHTGSGADIGIYISSKTTTGFTFQPDRTTYVNWQVCGMAA